MLGLYKKMQKRVDKILYVGFSGEGPSFHGIPLAGLSLLPTLEEQGALMDLIDCVPFCCWRRVHWLVLLGHGRQGFVSERE